MASFYAKSFIFDGVQSERYGLSYINLETGMSDSDSGNKVEVYEKYIYRRPKPFYYGRTQNTPLEFDITLGSEDVIDGTTRNLIQRWLLGRMEYLPLQIVQCDLQDVVFYVMFTESTGMYIGNMNYMLRLHAKCNSPWGYTFPKSYYVNYNNEDILDRSFNFYNSSVNNDYTYPKLTILTNNLFSNVGFTITNVTDTNRVTSMSGSGVSGNSTIVMDSDLQIASSSSSQNVLGQFNKNWFRLLPGNNNVRLQGAIKTFKMDYTFARGVGG